MNLLLGRGSGSRTATSYLNVQFKFYKGLLAMYSPFFEGAFSVPQPTVVSDADAVDGCQMIRLQDTAADVEYLLSYIIEPCVCLTSMIKNGTNNY